MDLSKRRFILTMCLGLIFCISSTAQNAVSNWKVKLEPAKAFIENQGQFRNPQVDGTIMYAYDALPLQIYFTPSGTTYSFTKVTHKEKDRTKEEKFETTEEWLMAEKDEKRSIINADFAAFQWAGGNMGVELIPSEKRSDYFSYTNKNAAGEWINTNNIPGFSKLTYRNIYPGIDVEYTFHPTDGLKYVIYVHPGADVTQIRMKYNKKPTLDNNGNLHISTIFGDIIDHAPVTYYEGSPLKQVASRFVITENMVTFDLGSYDHNQTIVIDPWVQTPTIPNCNGVWECERDGAGNVYVIGGDIPMKLIKYNNLGTLQWTFSTPFDTSAGDWLGTFVTDLAGNSYVTNGSSAELLKVNTSGGQVYLVSGGFVDEYWNIAWNSDQTRLIIGGTRCLMPITTAARGMIFDINTSNGSVNSTQEVGTYKSFSVLGMPQDVPNEVRSITSSFNARYYYLTLDSLGAIDQTFSACGDIFKIPSTYSFAYKHENFRPNNGNSGTNSIRASQDYLYTVNGANIHKRSLADGSVLGSAAIPGGANSTVALMTPTAYQVHNAGLEVDNCGNVYAGSETGVVKFDPDLTVITTHATSFLVYDVCVTDGGNVFACGATGDNSSTSRTGYIEYFNMSACAPAAPTNCNANVCTPPVVCSTDAPFNLTPVSTGGTFSGTGITDPVNGTFDPAIAGPGTHYVYYTMPCGTDSVIVTVNYCTTITMCQETNGDVSVSSGVGPYTWYSGTRTQDCSQCLVPMFCQPPAANCPIYTITWTVIGTGSTITPPTDTLMVVDASSNSDTTYSIASLPVCGACPDLNLTASSIVNSTCFDSNDGSFGATVYAGTAPYSYILQLGGTTVASVPGAGSSQMFTNLAPGSYMLYVTDNGGCIDSVSVTITAPAAVTVNIAGVLTFCQGGSTTLDAGAGYTSYYWSTTESTQTIDVTTGGTYSVTVTNASGCPGTDEVNVVATTSADATITSTGPVCILDGVVTLTAVDPGGTWSGTGITDANAGSFDPTIGGVGNYQIIYTISGACGDADTAIITVVSVYDATITPIPPLCTSEDTVLLVAADPGGAWFIDGVANNGILDPNLIGGGDHEIIYTIPGNCGSSDTITVTVYQAPALTATVSPQICREFNDGSIHLNITNGTLPYVISWSNGDDSTSMDSIAPGLYTVTVTDNNGCKVSASYNVAISDSSCVEPIIYVPNIFTPNGDGINDNLIVHFQGVEGMTFLIYNRWGQKVYEGEYQYLGSGSTPGSGISWDGKLNGKIMDDAVFVYYLKATLSNGDEIKRKGSITLIK